MKERPIFMTPENAQKCHEGVKTQTRRTNGLDEVNSSKLWDYPQMQKSGIAVFLDSTQANPYNNALDVKCPYGQVGDRLWIREACWVFGSWKKNGRTKTGRQKWKFIEAGRKEVFFDRASVGYPLRKGDAGFGFVRRPAIFMPRWACRTVVELTEIRVERLHDISPSDALAEGIFCPEIGYAQHGDRAPVLLYWFLWESINGKDSWALNPWVWVIAFRKVSS